MKKMILAIAVAMLFALPIVASAAPVFPGITSSNTIRINGPKVTFITMSGFVPNLNVTFTTFTGISPKATTKVRNFNKARGDRGVEEHNSSLIVPDASGRFVEFADSIEFGSDAELDLFGDKHNGLEAPLLTPRGNKAFGPVEFNLILSPDISELLMPNIGVGQNIEILGGADVTIIITNKKLGKGVMLLNNMQPAVIRKRTVLGNTSSIAADARVSMSAAVKTFQLHTSLVPVIP